MAVATLKHVLAYGIEQWSPSGNWSDDVYDRINYDSIVTPLDMEDSYTQPFKHAIQKGGAAGIMYACNSVNGVPAVASADLAGRLRSWGFTGYRTTDGDGIEGINSPSRQNYTTNVADSIRIAMTDGESDIDDGNTFKDHLIDAMEAGKGMDMSTVRRALFNTMRIRFRLGLFDPPAAQKEWSKFGMEQVDSPASQQLNMEASRQSLVLLQNHKNTLPFKATMGSAGGEVVVIGGSANSTRLLGSGHYARTLAIVDGFETGGFPGIPQAISALLQRKWKQQQQNALSAGAAAPNVRYLPGIQCSHRTDSVCIDPKADTSLLAEAVAAAKSATQVVLVLNLQSRAPCDTDKAYRDGGNEFNPCGYESEQHDRPNVALPKHQEALALAVLAATKARDIPTAVVLVHGGGLGIESIKAQASAILDAHYPGEVTGAAAIADALYGEFSPAGKLSYSVMPSAFQNISDFSSMDMTKAPGRTYKYYPSSPDYPSVLWPFGWGLTYSKFNISIVPARATSTEQDILRTGDDPNGPSQYTVRLRNSGSVDSDEVVEVFFAPLFTRPDVATPKRQLIDFERMHVAAGASVTKTFTVSASQLQLVNADGTRTAHAGKYVLIFTNGVDATSTVDITVLKSDDTSAPVVRIL